MSRPDDKALPDVTLAELQRLVASEHDCHGWNASAKTLMLGVVEEVGELAKAMLVYHTNDYCIPYGKVLADYDDAPHEIGDIIVYLMGLCNVLGIEPTFHLKVLDEQT